MSTNLYDLLDVEEDATEDQIRAAWKSAIADLDPTERRFRAYSDAAGVLLDRDKRAAYDAELAAERAAEQAAQQAAQQAVEEVPADVPAASAPTLAAAAPADAADAPGARAAGPGKVALIVTAVAAVLAVALAVTLVLTPGASGKQSAKQIAQANQRVESAAIAAEGAAEQMVGPVLSYDHKTMAADLERLRGYMTERMAEKQAAGWPALTKEAESQQVVVEAKSAGTALTRVSANGRRATVVVFIDQYVTKADQDPFVLRMWATLVLVKAAGSDARWLLDKLCTDDRCEE
ncbi:J domain-containing protein [Nocardioides nitrophenolicus]|uniref:J domain-containing protein n=1 Tax=Nocardioides nitrophenolicus TaxID=60489 RepID=UPI001959C0CD|nr:hypothetical protein [Nocardioides nitrophenolicus]MBM7518378.1 Mce-associated membrane protein [Nocardioides nitrophenolicus]